MERAVRRAMRDAERRLPEQTVEGVIDVLTDLRHYCAYKGLNFDECLRQSEYHYYTEHLEEEK